MDIFEFLEEFGSQNLLTDPNPKWRDRDNAITSAVIQSQRTMRKNYSRDLTDEELNNVVREAELAYDSKHNSKWSSFKRNVAAL